MTVLSNADRQICADLLNQSVSSERDTFTTLNKADIRAAVNALDDFFEANGAAINSAIPQPARSALTTGQKAKLITFVIRRRYLGV